MTDLGDLPELVRHLRLEADFKQNRTVHKLLRTRHGSPKYETWTRERKIGHGGFGEVWLERKLDSTQNNSGAAKSKLRAVKCIHASLQRRDYVRELEALATFSSNKTKYREFFVQFHGWFESTEWLHAVMEYCERGDLRGYIKQHQKIPEEEVQDITRQLLVGVSLMHKAGFAHRDIKPANIFVKSAPPAQWWVKLGDLGLTKRTETITGPSTVRATPGFVSPELLGFTGEEPKRADPFPSDIWGLAETVFQALTSQGTFDSYRQLMDYTAHRVSFPREALDEAEVSEAGVEFIRSLMSPLPLERLTADQALNHPWMVLKDDAESDGGDTAKLQDPDAIIDNYMVPGHEGEITQPATRWTTDVETAGFPSTKGHRMQVIPPRPRPSTPVCSTFDLASSHLQPRQHHQSETVLELEEAGGHEGGRTAAPLPPPEPLAENTGAGDRRKFQAYLEDGDEDPRATNCAEEDLCKLPAQRAASPKVPPGDGPGKVDDHEIEQAVRETAAAGTDHESDSHYGNGSTTTSSLTSEISFHHPGPRAARPTSPILRRRSVPISWDDSSSSEEGTSDGSRPEELWGRKDGDYRSARSVLYERDQRKKSQAENRRPDASRIRKGTPKKSVRFADENHGRADSTEDGPHGRREEAALSGMPPRAVSRTDNLISSPEFHYGYNVEKARPPTRLGVKSETERQKASDRHATWIPAVWVSKHVLMSEFDYDYIHIAGFIKILAPLDQEEIDDIIERSRDHMRSCETFCAHSRLTKDALSQLPIDEPRYRRHGRIHRDLAVHCGAGCCPPCRHVLAARNQAGQIGAPGRREAIKSGARRQGVGHKG